MLSSVLEKLKNSNNFEIIASMYAITQNRFGIPRFTEKHEEVGKILQPLEFFNQLDSSTSQKYKHIIENFHEINETNFFEKYLFVFDPLRLSPFYEDTIIKYCDNSTLVKYSLQQRVNESKCYQKVYKSYIADSKFDNNSILKEVILKKINFLWQEKWAEFNSNNEEFVLIKNIQNATIYNRTL